MAGIEWKQLRDMLGVFVVLSGLMWGAAGFYLDVTYASAKDLFEVQTAMGDVRDSLDKIVEQTGRTAGAMDRIEQRNLCQQLERGCIQTCRAMGNVDLFQCPCVLPEHCEDFRITRKP